MIELAMIFVGGLLGSSHCLGMCGGFAIMIGANAKTAGQAWRAQLLYSSGRIFTYTVLGAIAGFVGMRIGDWSLNLVNLSAILCLVAGSFLLVQGLKAAGVRIWATRRVAATSPCLFPPLLRSFLQSNSQFAVVLAGMMTGFLPCGLLYGFLALATASQDLIAGSAIMLAFGLGTIPLLAFAGVGGRLLSAMARLRLLRAAAWCVVLTGGLTLYRGATMFSMSPAQARAHCPLCTTVHGSANDDSRE